MRVWGCGDRCPQPLELVAPQFLQPGARLCLRERLKLKEVTAEAQGLCETGAGALLTFYGQLIQSWFGEGLGRH